MVVGLCGWGGLKSARVGGRVGVVGGKMAMMGEGEREMGWVGGDPQGTHRLSCGRRVHCPTVARLRARASLS